MVYHRNRDILNKPAVFVGNRALQNVRYESRHNITHFRDPLHRYRNFDRASLGELHSYRSRDRVGSGILATTPVGNRIWIHHALVS